MRRRAARASRRMSDRTTALFRACFRLAETPRARAPVAARGAGRKVPRGPRCRSARRDRASQCFAPQCRRPSAKRAGRAFPERAAPHRTAGRRTPCTGIARQAGASSHRQIVSPTTAASQSPVHPRAGSRRPCARATSWASPGDATPGNSANSVRGRSRPWNAFRRAAAQERPFATHHRSQRSPARGWPPRGDSKSFSDTVHAGRRRERLFRRPPADPAATARWMRSLAQAQRRPRRHRKPPPASAAAVAHEPRRDATRVRDALPASRRRSHRSRRVHQPARASSEDDAPSARSQIPRQRSRRPSCRTARRSRRRESALRRRQPPRAAPGDSRAAHR